MLEKLLLAFHVIFALVLVVLILIQKDQGMGALGVKGVSQTLFGSQGTGSFIKRLTAFMGLLLFTTSIALNTSYFKVPPKHETFTAQKAQRGETHSN